MSAAKPLSDAATRRRIGPWHPDRLPALDDFDPETNFVVRAAAGSGKTTALVARIVGLVRSGVPIDECAAITFTRKAASEMKARLYEELGSAEQLLRQDPSNRSDERARVRRAQKNLPRCFIGTIHAFCARLLRERPLTAGLSPDLTPGIDDRRRRELRNQSWQAYLSDVWDEDPDRVHQIASLGIDPAELVHFFGELCRYPDLTPYVDGPETPPDLTTTARELSDFVDRWYSALPDDPGDGAAKPGAAATAIRTANRFRMYRAFDDPSALAEFIGLFDDVTKADDRKSTETDVRGDLTKNHWLDSEGAKRLDNEILPELYADVVEPALRQWKSYVHRQVVEFTFPAVERYAERRRETGQLTFQDLLLHARSLLRDHPDARRALQREYPRLLVDEFQDTDPIQAEILFYLASRDPTERHWRQCTPRDGSLFIVGDDKQSIYRFRRADLDVYMDVRESIGAAENGADVALETNFRSVGPILDWFNETFATLFGSIDEPYQAPYVHFEADRDERPAEPVVRQLEVPYVSGSSYPTDVAARNAEQVASYIASACRSKAPLLTTEDGATLVDGSPGDFMILTRDTTRLDRFAEALADRGLPYTLAGGKDVKASTELWALVTLLTCVERRQDAVARVAYLRGPLVGLSDDALYRYSTADGTFDGSFELPGDVANALPEDLASRFETAFGHLRLAQEWLHNLRPAAAIERLVDRLGLMARTRRSEGLGSLHAGRLLRVLTDVQRLDAEGYTWTEIRDELQLVLDGERDLDGMTLETGTDEAVRLLNVHKAKGLEAPVVFLADPYGGGRNHGPDEHVRRTAGEVVLPVYEEHRFNRTLRYAPERWAMEFKETEARYQAAESQRLLYVAATRAQDLLVVSRYRNENWSEEKGYWAPLYPHLEGKPTLAVPDSPPPPEQDASAAPKSPAASEHEREQVLRPSYRAARVTDGQAGTSIPSGLGPDFGEAIHELFAHLIRHRTATSARGVHPNLIRAVLSKHEESPRQSTAEAMVHTFLASALWTQICAADTVHVEYPVSSLNVHEDDVPSLVTGSIDLLFRHEDAWTLIDHKTDRVPGDSTPLVQAYRPQIDAYTQMWERATEQTIERRGLWLADPGTFVSL